MMTMTNVLTCLVGLLHGFFLAVEVFFWRRPLGLRMFRMSQEFADTTAMLAANQGIYNGFLAAGLFWGVFLGRAPQAFSIKLYFLSCVVVAGVFGAATVSKRILWVQAAPAALAIVCHLFFD